MIQFSYELNINNETVVNIKNGEDLTWHWIGLHFSSIKVLEKYVTYTNNYANTCSVIRSYVIKSTYQKYELHGDSILHKQKGNEKVSPTHDKRILTYCLCIGELWVTTKVTLR